MSSLIPDVMKWKSRVDLEIESNIEIGYSLDEVFMLWV